MYLMMRATAAALIMLFFCFRFTQLLLLLLLRGTFCLVCLLFWSIVFVFVAIIMIINQSSSLGDKKNLLVSQDE